MNYHSQTMQHTLLLVSEEDKILTPAIHTDTAPPNFDA